MKIEGKIVLSQTDLVALLASVLSSKMGLTSSLDFDFNFTQKRKGEAGLETVIDYAGEQDVSVLNDAIAALISEAPVAKPAVKKAATKDVDEDELDDDEEEEEEEEPAPRKRGRPAAKAEPEAPTRRRRLTK